MSTTTNEPVISGSGAEAAVISPTVQTVATTGSTTIESSPTQEVSSTSSPLQLIPTTGTDEGFNYLLGPKHKCFYDMGQSAYFSTCPASLVRHWARKAIDIGQEDVHFTSDFAFLKAEFDNAKRSPHINPRDGAELDLIFQVMVKVLTTVAKNKIDLKAAIDILDDPCKKAMAYTMVKVQQGGGKVGAIAAYTFLKKLKDVEAPEHLQDALKAANKEAEKLRKSAEAGRTTATKSQAFQGQEKFGWGGYNGWMKGSGARGRGGDFRRERPNAGEEYIDEERQYKYPRGAGRGGGRGRGGHSGADGGRATNG